MILPRDLFVKYFPWKIEDRKKFENEFDEMYNDLVESLLEDLNELNYNYRLLLSMKYHVFGEDDSCVSFDNLISYYIKMCALIREILNSWDINPDDYKNSYFNE